MKVPINLVEVTKEGKKVRTIKEDVILPEEAKRPNTILVIGEEDPKTVYITKHMTYLYQEQILNYPIIKIGTTKTDPQITAPNITLTTPPETTQTTKSK